MTSKNFLFISTNSIGVLTMLTLLSGCYGYQIRSERGTPEQAKKTRESVAQGMQFLSEVNPEINILFASITDVAIVKSLLQSSSSALPLSDVTAASGTYIETTPKVFNHTPNITDAIIVEYANGLTLVLDSFIENTDSNIGETVLRFKLVVQSNQRSIVTPIADRISMDAIIIHQFIAHQLYGQLNGILFAGDLSYQRPDGTFSSYKVMRSNSHVNSAQLIRHGHALTITINANTSVRFTNEITYIPVNSGLWLAKKIRREYGDSTVATLNSTVLTVDNFIDAGKIAYRAEGSISLSTAVLPWGANFTVGDIVGGPVVCDSANPGTVASGPALAVVWEDGSNTDILPDNIFNCHSVIVEQPNDIGLFGTE